MTKTTPIRLDDSLAARLDELAAAVNRPRTWLIEQAIQEALDEYRAGAATTKPHEQVMRALEARISAKRTP
ncbi:MAG: CopG family ribbon-helix-helix protein [Chloroflexia bacterium]